MEAIDYLKNKLENYENLENKPNISVSYSAEMEMEQEDAKIVIWEGLGSRIQIVSFFEYDMLYQRLKKSKCLNLMPYKLFEVTDKEKIQKLILNAFSYRYDKEILSDMIKILEENSLKLTHK